MDKIYMSKWGIRVLHLVIWLAFSFVTCLAIKWLWEEVPGLHPLILYPLTTIVATGISGLGRAIILEMRGLYVKVEPIEHDKPMPIASWPASVGRDKFQERRAA